MGASSGDGFPKPAAETEAEWRQLLTAVVGPLRIIFGDGPRVVAIGTGAPVMAAQNTGRDQPTLVTVQVLAPSTVIFGRAQGVTALNGVQHAFPADGSSFQQLLMPSERLFAISPGAPLSLVVFQTVV